MGIHNNSLIGASGQQGYQISRSVRTRSNVSAYFNRTLTTPTLGTKWTWSGWVKRGTLGAAQTLFSGQVDVNNWGIIAFLSGDTLTFQQADAGSVTSTVTTTQVFRDSSAWYHIIVVFDSTQATAANRLIMYVNGVQITAFGTATYLAQNTVSRINAAVSHQISRYISAAQYFDGYMTEVNFIDGQALTPSSFGETNVLTGVWQPKAYSGTYGTNGFELNFSDNSAATAAAIGKDSSGNGNNWTPNVISVTAGATYDSMLDTPTPYTDGGNGRGNYAIMSPLFTAGQAQTTVTRSQGNLVITSSDTANWAGTGSSINFGMSSSFYAEVQLFTGTFQGHAFGVVKTSDHVALNQRTSASPYSGICINHQGAVYRNGVNIANVAATTNGDVISIAFDGPNSQVIFKKNNAAWYTVTSVPVEEYVFYGYISDASYQIWNFGQRPFNYSVPTGFKALNTQNLPIPTITNGANHFAATAYTATPGTGATISNAVNGISFQPDLLWVKNRNDVETHYWQDSVRGFSPSTNTTKMLISASTAAEASLSDITCTTTSSGFTVADSNPGTGEFWLTNRTYVGWQWKAGGAAVTNTNGTISSQVSANPTAGFSIVTYTGTGAAATVGHGLSVAPRMLIVKERSAAGDDWYVYHSSIGTNTIFLSTTAASSAGGAAAWNSTAPTSTVFSLGTSVGVNASTQTYVAYCFAAVAGYSAFGSYTGTGSADGTFVFLGFRPRFLLIKRSDAINQWMIFDTSRSTYNQSFNYLIANLVQAEAATSGTTDTLDFLSNGFKLRGTTAAENASGGTYIYAAFAENPFKNSLAR